MWKPTTPLFFFLVSVSVSVSPALTPRHSSLLSSTATLLHMTNQSVVDWIPPKDPYGMPLNHTTLADVLRRGGYDTHAVGKVC